MKLYDAPGAPNPRRVRWFLAEKGIEDLPITTLNLLKGEHRTRDYLDRAGLAQAPALEMDDGTTITESIAICRYLESLHPEPNMFGRTPKETAVIEMWTRRAEQLLAMPLMHGVRHAHPLFAALEGAQVPERLGRSVWLAADRLTIADIVAFVGLDFARLIKVRPPAEFGNLNRWVEAMRARPAASR